MKNKSIVLSSFLGLFIGFFFAGIVGFDISNAFANQNYIDSDPSLSIGKDEFGDLYNLSSNHNYLPILGEDVYQMANDNETFILYIGRSNCPYCQKIVPELMKAAENYNFNVIYHVDILDEANSAFVHQQQINGVPLVLLFKDGTVVDSISGYINQSEIEIKLDNSY